MLGCTGAAAVVGGVLLAIRPDGSLLRANTSVLVGTPFHDWKVPGLLLATLVGAGGLGTMIWTATRGPFRRRIAVAYGAGLLGFEIAEWVWIGPQALEVVFGVVGLLIAGLAATSRTLVIGHVGREDRPG